MIKFFKKIFRWLGFYFSQKPFYTIFYITSRCNAHCSHCFNWQLVDNASKRKELSLAEIKKTAKNWGKMLITNLSGGEPFLRSDLVEIVRILKKYTGVEIIAIPSNGLMTDHILTTIKKLLKEFPDIYFRFTFSIDGMKEVHDKIRGIDGAFDKVITTTKKVKELKSEYKNFSLFTNSCFMQSNQDTLLDTLKFIRNELAVDSISVTYIRGHARSTKTQANLQQQEYKKIIQYLAEFNRDKYHGHPLGRLIWQITNYTRYKVLENLKTGRRNFKCYVIKKMTVVEDNGEVKICEILSTSLGNLRDFDYDIKKIVSSKLAKSEYKKIKNKQCNCTWECAIRTGIIYNPLEYFSLLKWIFFTTDKNSS